VPQLTFAQSGRHSLLAPVLLAFLILGIVIALILRATPHKTADLTITRTVVFPVHIVLKADSIVVGRDQSQDDLYVLTNLRIDDHLHLPLFLKDFTATLTTAEGEELTTSAIEEQDLVTLYTTFPKLKSLSSKPLLRETMIDPGQSTEGMILLHFPIRQAVWDHRRTAFLNVDLYHQGRQDVLIGRANETIHDTSPSQTP
jgi:hypothetical protein